MRYLCPICEKIVSNIEEEGKCDVCNSSTKVFECSDRHHICSACLDSQVFKEMKSVCLASDSIDPYKIFEEILSCDGIRMHDYKHHVFVGASLLTAHCNAGSPLDLDKVLDEMIKRGRKVPPGSCGFMGNCGAAVSVGIFMSIMTGTTPYSEDTWGDVNLATAQALIQMALIGGPRCCKRNSYVALGVGSRIAIEKFGSLMEPGNAPVCMRSSDNNECIKERCSFYKP